MEQRLSVLTIAARDLEAMRRFYEDTLGWEPLVYNADVVFYKMNGFLFSLTRRKFLAEFIGINEQGSGFTGVTLGCNYKSEAEVRAVYEKLRGRGVPMLTELTVPPFGGLFFYFQDIEGNILEVAYNAFIPLDERNNAVDHKPIDGL